MTTYRCLLVYVPSNEKTIENAKNFLWQEADALIKDLGDCEGSSQPSGRASSDEPLTIPGIRPSEAAQQEAQKKATDYVSGKGFLPSCPIHQTPLRFVSICFGEGCAYITVECRAHRHFFNLNYDLESIDGLIKK